MASVYAAAGELLERSFAHAYETDEMRRVYLRGRDNVLKRVLNHVGALNLSLVMRKLLGKGRRRRCRLNRRDRASQKPERRMSVLGQRRICLVEGDLMCKIAQCDHEHNFGELDFDMPGLFRSLCWRIFAGRWHNSFES